MTGALGVRELRPEAVVVACDSSIDSTRGLQPRSPATEGRSDLGWGAIAPHPNGPVSAADFAAFPTGAMRVFTDPTSIRPKYRLGCPFLGSEKWHHLMRRTAFAERWLTGPGSRKGATDLSEILIRSRPAVSATMGTRAFVVKTVERQVASASRLRRHRVFMSASKPGVSRGCPEVALAREPGERGGPSDQ